MSGRDKPVRTTDYRPQSGDSLTLKQQLVSAVANGDELAAAELRLLLKINQPEHLRGSLKNQ